jgi:FixJ family two-component response regulator
MSEVKGRAGRYRNLSKDEVFREVMEGVKSRQIAVFLSSSATIEQIERARHMVVALSEIEAYIQTALDDEMVYDKKLN